MIVGVNLADDVLKHILHSLMSFGLHVFVFGALLAVFSLGYFLPDLDLFELVDGRKLVHGVGKVLDNLALLLVEDGQN